MQCARDVPVPFVVLSSAAIVIAGAHERASTRRRQARAAHTRVVEHDDDVVRGDVHVCAGGGSCGARERGRGGVVTGLDALGPVADGRLEARERVLRERCGGLRARARELAVRGGWAEHGHLRRGGPSILGGISGRAWCVRVRSGGREKAGGLSETGRGREQRVGAALDFMRLRWDLEDVSE